MSLKLNSSGGGSVTLQEPSTASTRTLTLPDNTGSLVSTADTGTVTPTMLSQKLTLETAKASTSGTNIDFTGIPSWVKRITIIFQGVSTNAAGSSAVIAQLGVSGTPTASGYTCIASTLGASTISTTTASTAGFSAMTSIANATVFTGQMVISNITSNTWVASSSCARTDSAINIVSNGSVALSGTLNMVRVTTVNGTDAFDAGSINIMYEG